MATKSPPKQTITEKLAALRTAADAQAAAERAAAVDLYWTVVRDAARDSEAGSFDLAAFNDALGRLKRTMVDFDDDLRRAREVVDADVKFGAAAQAVAGEAFEAVTKPAAAELDKLRPRVAELERAMTSARSTLNHFQYEQRAARLRAARSRRELGERGCTVPELRLPPETPPVNIVYDPSDPPPRSQAARKSYVAPDDGDL